MFGAVQDNHFYVKKACKESQIQTVAALSIFNRLRFMCQNIAFFTSIYIQAKYTLHGQSVRPVHLLGTVLYWQFLLKLSIFNLGPTYHIMTRPSV